MRKANSVENRCWGGGDQLLHILFHCTLLGACPRLRYANATHLPLFITLCATCVYSAVCVCVCVLHLAGTTIRVIAASERRMYALCGVRLGTWRRRHCRCSFSVRLPAAIEVVQLLVLCLCGVYVKTLRYSFTLASASARLQSANVQHEH